MMIKWTEGKGPEKEKYEERIRKLSLKRVAFRTMWLSAEDYPLLLGNWKPSMVSKFPFLYKHLYYPFLRKQGLQI